MEVEDESALNMPLLAGNDQQQSTNSNISNDGAILSQLFVAPGGEDSARSKKSYRCCKTKNREMLALFIFAILTWLGFVLTLFATYSCNLIHVTWNPHSIHLSITGVGIHRFEQTIRNQKKHIKEIKCFDQMSYVQHAEISSSKHFFPSDEFVQKASVVAPTLAGVAFAGVMVYMVVASTYVDTFTNRLNYERYPWKTLSICYILVGLILVSAGTAELLTVLDLLNVADPTDDHHDSPICNAEYSTCQLGMGGNIAVSGVACCFAAALLAFSAAYVTINDAMSARRVIEADRPIQHETVGSLS